MNKPLATSVFASMVRLYCCPDPIANTCLTFCVLFIKCDSQCTRYWLNIFLGRDMEQKKYHILFFSYMKFKTDCNDAVAVNNKCDRSFIVQARMSKLSLSRIFPDKGANFQKPIFSNIFW